MQQAAEILRDQKGNNNTNIGMGNPKAINQLLAHHSVIFQPQTDLVWYSTQPWQMGALLAYDLKSIFSHPPTYTTSLSVDSLTIESDPFLQSNDFINFQTFSQIKEK